MGVVVLSVSLVLLSVVALGHSEAATVTDTPYPLGTPSGADVSGYALPANSFAGYHETYATGFTGSALPANWDAYSGPPGGDPGAMFDPSAVSVSNNLLSLTATQNPTLNPSTAGGNWITGGVCYCGVTGPTYGAFFYRSRITGAGPTTVGLLWPDSNSWPPEIDFNETTGGTGRTTATVHYSSNHLVLNDLDINMTQWHTWGVIWSPTSITYTVDGEVWGVDPNASSIPNVPMHLSIQQQTFCGATTPHACPTSTQSTLVDWVAEYSADSGATTTSSSTSTTSPTTSSTSTSSTSSTSSTVADSTSTLYSGPTSWTATSSAQSLTTTPATSVAYPSLTPSSSGEFYGGFAYTPGGALSSSDATSVYSSTSSNTDQFATASNVSSATSPLGSQSNAATSVSVGALIATSGLADGDALGVGHVLQGSGNGLSDAMVLTPLSANDAYVVGLRVSSATADVASLTGGDAQWSLVTSFRDVADSQELELWLGVVDSTTPDPLIVTPSVANTTVQIAVQEVQDAVPPTTTTAAPTTTTSSTTSTTSTSSTTTSTTTTSTTSTTTSTTSTTTTTTTTVPPTTTTVVIPTTQPPSPTTTTSTPSRPGRPTLYGGRITNAQARVRWAAAGHVTRVVAALYVTSGCTRAVRTQAVPNKMDPLADHLIHFSTAPNGAARAHSFTPGRTYFVKIISLLGPGGAGPMSRCTRLGRG